MIHQKERVCPTHHTYSSIHWQVRQQQFPRWASLANPVSSNEFSKFSGNPQATALDAARRNPMSNTCQRTRWYDATYGATRFMNHQAFNWSLIT